MKQIFRLLVFFLVISLLINFYLFFYSLKIYRQYKKLQIDPSSSLMYQHLNDNISFKTGNFRRIVFFGDSRIYQWNPLPEISGCEIINRGIPGETTSQALLRIERDVINLKPDVVIVQTGVNDCNSIGILPDFEKYIASNCLTNFGHIIEKLKMNKIKIIILSVFPFGDVDFYRFPFWSEKSRDVIKYINMNLQKYESSGVLFINCDSFFLDDNIMKEDYSLNMLHLNKEGYLKLNEFIEPYIQKMIQ